MQSGQPHDGADRRNLLGAFRRIWDFVPATAAAIAADLARLGGVIPARRPWGIVPDDPATADWTAAVGMRGWSEEKRPAVHVQGTHPFMLGPGCRLAPGVSVDVTAGPVLLGRDVRVMPHCHLEGPLYIGSGSLVKSGTAIYGETSLGAVSKVAGEIAGSTFLDMSNKQHEGFIGHAYIGSWCNLGALTTCSDLKNTYGSIRVDLGNGAQDTGLRFIGVLMGEHCKTAVGTLLNTATCVGYSSNVFGSGFPAKSLPNFTWGDGRSLERQDPRRAAETARSAMSRRMCRLTSGHEKIFRYLAG
jgi:UDP-N-acetylglucosamine diphosphorylase / glucose-1-phosphate thymidylyltransferase / UDP-N-acetylgalactosamine diphosphorylase / glucosamine-1-phosphate N-acetyltransferase / galactosamine-1-phosphate N-acetyltransferase